MKQPVINSHISANFDHKPTKKDIETLWSSAPDNATVDIASTEQKGQNAQYTVTLRWTS